MPDKKPQNKKLSKITKKTSNSKVKEKLAMPDPAIAGATEIIDKSKKPIKKVISTSAKAKAANAVKLVKHPKSKHSKKYKSVIKLIDRTKVYDLAEAIELAKKTSFVKFNAAVEIHARLGVDPTLTDQNVRASALLPHGTGKKIKIAVLVTPTKTEEAKASGADYFREEDVINMLQKEQYNFDMLIVEPDMMAQLAKFAKTLGPKGLMPNPKSGTVTKDVAKMIKQVRGGKIEFKMDKQGIIHQVIGRVNFTSEQLVANAKTFIEALYKAKPASLKKPYIQSIAITTTMGPAIRLNTNIVKKEG